MKKLIKIGLFLLGFGLIAAFGTYLYVFHKPHRNIAKEKPAYVLDASQLYADFSSNEEDSYNKYGNKVILVRGEVVDIAMKNNSASITLIDEMEGINCAFDSTSMIKNKDKLEKISNGDVINIKGQCDGYDMIMGVVLSRCYIE